jgi:hypothetical protein
LYSRYILDVFKHDTGKDFEIHITQECGIKGSLNALISDATHHVRDASERLHMPEMNIQDQIMFHKSRKSLFGLMINSPWELTGKLSNYVSIFPLRVIILSLPKALKFEWRNH